MEYLGPVLIFLGFVLFSYFLGYQDGKLKQNKELKWYRPLSKALLKALNDMQKQNKELINIIFRNMSLCNSIYECRECCFWPGNKDIKEEDQCLVAQDIILLENLLNKKWEEIIEE